MCNWIIREHDLQRLTHTSPNTHLYTNFTKRTPLRSLFITELKLVISESSNSIGFIFSSLFGHHTVFALQIGGTGVKGGREDRDANLKQERDALDVDLSLLLKNKKTSILSLKKKIWEHVTSYHSHPLSIICSFLFLPSLCRITSPACDLILCAQ